MENPANQQSQEENLGLEPTKSYFMGIRLAAFFIILMGLAFSCLWLENYIVLDQLTAPDYLMAFSTGLCFILEGAVLVLYTFSKTSRNRFIIITLSLFIGLIAILALLDNFTNCHCAIDYMMHSLKTGTHPSHHITVMALNTALAQLFLSIIIMLIPNGKDVLVFITLHALTLFCFLISFVSILGYLLELDILYRWYGIQPMSVFTSVGIFIVTFSLWQIWRREEWFENIYEGKEKLRISIIFSLIVFVVTMISALSVFSETIKREKTIAMEVLVEDVNERVYLLNKYIQQSLQVADTTRKSLKELAESKSNITNTLEDSVKIILKSSGATGFMWHDISNQIHLSYGQLLSDPDMTVPLSEQAELLLKHNKIFIRIPININFNNTTEIITTEWYLPLLTEFLTLDKVAEKTGDVFLCLLNSHKQATCYLSEKGYVIPGQLLMKEAGSLELKSNSGHIEILAYAKINELNLWMVMKKDLTELNHYNSETINRILIIVLFSILLGILIQFWQINPLLSGLIKTRYDAIEAKAKLVIKEKALKEGLKLQALLNEEATKLTLMTSALQTCATLKEGAEVCAWYCQKLLPSTTGILFLMLPSKAELEAISSWGNIHYKKFIRAKDCWAIREAGSHIVKEPTQDMICEHVKSESAEISPYFCVPLFAQGQIMGLLYIEFTKLMGTEITANTTNLINHLSGSMALALSNIRLREDLLSQSIHDPLTGLYNRKYLDEVFNSNMSLAIRKNLGLALMMIDIDHFKNVNDQFGHQAGDLVLQAVGTLLQKQIRLYNTACRFGGEEFLIIMVDILRDDAIKRAEVLREVIEKLEIVHHGEPLPPITVSIGIATFPENARNPQTLIELADQALYQAKLLGRNRVEVSK